MTSPKSLNVRSLLALLALALVLAGCGGSGDGSGTGEGSTGESRPFSELADSARGSTVNLFAYAGDERTNAYLDDWIAPRMKRETGITLKRTPVSDTADAVNKLLNEKQASDEAGTMDLVWVNGENFYTGSQADLWFGPWAQDLPNARYVDYKDPAVSRDFGYPTGGYEAAWSQAQFVMVYDSRRVEDPPKSMEELAKWVKNNPGRFTYPAPPDFFGNAFILQALYQLTDGPKTYTGPFDRETFDERKGEFTDYMNSIEPYLWRKGETYPRSGAALDKLYQDGEVDFTLSYNPYSAQQQVNRGVFPDSTRTYLFDQGTLSNVSYLAVPFNSRNKAGAEVAANFMQSPEAQLELQRQNVVGGLAALDVEKLPAKRREDFQKTTGGEAVPPLAELQRNQLPEARSEWSLALQEAWAGEVRRK